MGLRPCSTVNSRGSNSIDKTLATPPFVRLEDQGRHLVYIRNTGGGRSILVFPQPSHRRRMSLTSSFNSSQIPHQHNGSSSESHDQLGDLQALPDVVDLACPGPPRPPDPSTPTSFDPPSWKLLVLSSLTAHERISLITTMLSNRDEVEVVKHIRGEDAQILVDAIYEARSYILSSPKNGATDLDSNFRVSSIRCWTSSIAHYG